MYSNEFSPPPPRFVEKPSDDDFVCPPLPPPPSEEDLLEVASYKVTTNNSAVEDHEVNRNVISPTFKATSKYSSWTPKPEINQVNGTESQFTAPKSWKPSSKESGVTGYRSVARPMSKGEPDQESDVFSHDPFISSSFLNYNFNNNNNNMISSSDPGQTHWEVKSRNEGSMNDETRKYQSTASIILRKNSDTSTDNATRFSSDIANIPSTSFHPVFPSKSESSHVSVPVLLPATPTRSSMPNRMEKNGKLITLLRDTRHILIKPGSGPGTSTTTSKTTLSLPQGQEFPQPSESVKVTPTNELPDGAVYETHTIDGNVIHTDTYYPAPGGEKMVLERTKKTTVIKAEHHHGMGPMNEEGIPVALRSTVENPKAWYKNMFKQIHKLENEEDENASSENHDIEKTISHSPLNTTVKAKRMGRITDYTPSEPYVVENKPKKSEADYSSQGSSKSWFSRRSANMNLNGNKTKSTQADNKIPPESTSFHPPRKGNAMQNHKATHVEAIHGTEYNKNLDYTMADYVVSEPKQASKPQQPKPKAQHSLEKSQEKRQRAKAKFDFIAQTAKQLSLKKDQTVIITRDVNQDWYEGETADGKHSGIFPVSYVEVLEHAAQKIIKKGLAKAKFDFNGNNSKQLSVKKGDSIELVEKVDKNWYKGTIGTKTGILPANYIEVIREPQGETKPAANHTAAPKKVVESKPGNVSHKPSASSSSSNSEPDDKDKMTRASFLAHAVVNSGVHLSHSQPRRGEFDIPELDDASMGISPRDANARPHHTPQGSYDTTVSNTSSSLHSDLSQSLYITASDSSPQPPTSYEEPPKQKMSKAFPERNEPQDLYDEGLPRTQEHIALYPYVPQNEDELELIGGDVVNVIEKCDDGWYVGTCERTGSFGTFPGNYVIPVD